MSSPAPADASQKRSTKDLQGLDHGTFKIRAEAGYLRIGIQPSAAREFYTSHRLAGVRKNAGNFIILDQIIVWMLLAASPLCLLASLALALQAFAWWSILVIPSSTAVWWFNGGRASMGTPRVRLMSTVTLAALWMAFEKGGRVQTWICVLLVSMCCDRFKYWWAVTRFRRLLISSAAVYGLFRDLIHVVDTTGQRPRLCPTCHLTNPATAQRCDCGYEFESAASQTHEVEIVRGLLAAESEGIPIAGALIDDWWSRMRIDPGIQLLAGAAYAVGYGVPQDVVRGYAWMSLAVAANGAAANVTKLRDNLRLHMTADQFNAAAELVPLLVQDYPLSLSDRVKHAYDPAKARDEYTSEPFARVLMATYEEGRATAIDTLAAKFVELRPPLPEGLTEKVSFLQPLAKRGCPVAQMLLGMILTTGSGTQQKIECGQHWLEQAFDTDQASRVLAAQALYDLNPDALAHIEAQRNPGAVTYAVIGTVYAQGPNSIADVPRPTIFSGVTVKQDLVRGYAWVSLSAAHGGLPAAELRDRLLILLTPEQLSSAKEFANVLEKQYSVAQ
jgi:TPR repeat protein